MYYFYCPNCELEGKIIKLPKNTVSNIRDGYGMPINHYECPICHNLDAGAMLIREDNEDERKYYQYIINIYQGVRGFKNDWNSFW